MDLFEYQAKELFAKHNVPTSAGRVTDSAEGAKAIAEEIGKRLTGVAELHAFQRSNAAATSSSEANSPASAWRRPSWMCATCQRCTSR